MGAVSEVAEETGLARERRRESQRRYARIMVAERDLPIALLIVEMLVVS
jgi:hypothetical protein